MSNILDDIKSPNDLKHLTLHEMENIADELREFTISTVCKTGGHLAPNLGVVELTLALHKVFDTPIDKIVWDVGHQAYIHKILTGRKEQFHTLRQYEGISGFPKRSESEYDAFGVGHASTSISAALGMATARDLNQEKYKVIAVIGDGALSGGLAFEGLNNAGDAKRDLIVILNDNCMSISPNVGALSRYLTDVITRPFYNRFKDDVWDLTGKLPKGTNLVRGTVRRLEEGLKTMMIPGSIFERLGFRYFGPVDGHDLARLIRIFTHIKEIRGPILVHLVTTKGKGYKYAEENATRFHGLGSFCKETGESEPKKIPAYTKIFGEALVEIAEGNEKVVGITAAMADGTGLAHLEKRFPGRFFDVGIAEGHAVTFAAGLATQGLKPVVAIYSSFMQRCLDQVIHDVALQNLPVIFAMDRSGLVGEDGPTHHGVFDLSFMRIVPNLVLMAPKDENELRDMLYTAVQYDGPVALRYPRGACIGLGLKSGFNLLPIGKAEILQKGKDLAIFAVGDRVYPALDVASRLKENGVSAEVINARFVKPLDKDLILKVLHRFDTIVTIENNVLPGGFGSAIAEVIVDASFEDVRFRRFGLPDAFVPHGKLSILHETFNLSAKKVAEAIQEWTGKLHKHAKLHLFPHFSAK